MNRPNINVTPLIDVLLVLMIIFMVVSPLKPSSFKARVPAEPDTESPGKTHPDTIIVAIKSDLKIDLNLERDIASVAETAKLTDRLKQVFAQRLENGAVKSSPFSDAERPFADSIERTVFIEAPRSLDYGSVAKVVDAVKSGGAYPISLKIDGLDSP